ncbi:hypothetical protein [Streptomyces sp. NPDC014894]|uniref:hypothetical protein n=1 Tax=unclassified Streptomyces TaxID=2593676 RepID=UPI0037018447
MRNVKSRKSVKKRAAMSMAGALSLAAATLAAAPTAGASTAGGAAAANTTTSSVGYVCQSRYDGAWFPIANYARSFSTTAPTSIARNTNYQITFNPAPLTAAGQYNQQLKDVEVAYKVSSNAQVLSYSLTGGSNLGTAVFYVDRNGSEFVVKSIAGAIQGGVEFDIPTLVVTLRSANPGSVTAGPAGTSFTHRSFGWNRQHPLNGQWDPFQCYADPASPVVFSTTSVS